MAVADGADRTTSVVMFAPRVLDLALPAVQRKGDRIMAEQIVLVCDTCGRPATGAVNFSVVASGSARSAQRFTKDLCDTHLSELIKNARKPRRGRRRGSVAG